MRIDELDKTAYDACKQAVLQEDNKVLSIVKSKLEKP